MTTAARKFANNVVNEPLGVTEQHQCLIEVVERVVDTREARDSCCA